MLEDTHPWAKIYSLQQPVQFDQLGELLRLITAEPPKNADDGKQTIVGDSPGMQTVRQLIERVAPSTATVLINGESGTGKELIARELHRQSGRRGAFVAINCGAIPDHLLESELFGHERGAFTDAAKARAGKIQLAERGTLFLDEIGDMPTAMQVKLLRVLQERVVDRVGGTSSIPVDIRVVAASHRDLPAMVEAGSFREDLYYRLSVFPIDVPPLRERGDDVEALFAEFATRLTHRYGVTMHVRHDAMTLLKAYAWPGNVRELANLVECLAVGRSGADVRPRDLPRHINPDAAGAPEQSRAAAATECLPEEGVNLKQHLAAIEKTMISAALEASDGVVQSAAKRLGTQRTTLVEKIRRYGLNPDSQ